MTSERLFNSFIPPKTCIPPKQISGYAPIPTGSHTLINIHSSGDKILNIHYIYVCTIDPGGGVRNHCKSRVIVGSFTALP